MYIYIYIYNIYIYNIYIYIYIYIVFPAGEMGESHPPAKNLLIPSPSSPPNIYSLPTKSLFNPTTKKNVIFSCSYSSCTIFVLILYFFETQVMLILISIDAQYS